VKIVIGQRAARIADEAAERIWRKSLETSTSY
jgi:hypothetical protein